MPRPLVSMREALADANLLGTMLPGDSWRVWRSLLIASRGEALTSDELELFRQRTGRDQAPTQPVDELAIVSGRRSGKTAASSVLAIYLSALVDWRDVLTRGGERGLLLFLAQSQRTARIAFRYADHAFRAVPLLAQQVISRSADAIGLRNNIDLEIRPASFRGLRGVTAIGVIADEIAFWFNEETSANPDHEILAAVRPALATTGGPVIMVSTPYAKRGELWSAYKRHHGPDGDPAILVAQGASRDFNATLSAAVVNRALAADPEKAEAEYLGRFRDDIATYLTHEAVMACVDVEVDERLPEPGHHYYGFVDPSGGAMDAMTLSICHKEGLQAVVDCVREARPPFDPVGVVHDFVAVCRRYGVGLIYGDRYAGEWVRSSFIKLGVGYEPSPLTKSQIYVDLAPQVNSGRVVLLDNERLITQLTGLERRTGRGTDIVDHGPGGHDDVANAVAGAVRSMGFADVIRRPAYRSPQPKPGQLPYQVGSLFGLEGFPPGPRDAGRGRIRI